MRDAKTAAPGFTPYAIYSSPETRFNYSIWDGLEYYTFAHVPMPSGIALDATTLYVASHADGCVYALSRASGALMQLINPCEPSTPAKQEARAHVIGIVGSLAAADVA